MTTIGARARELAHTNGDRIFCTFLVSGLEEHLTYRALYRRASCYAASLREHGVSAGDVVIIILEHTPHLFYAFLGAVLAGAIPSFMPYPNAKQRADIYWEDHRRLFERVQPAAIVTYEDNARAAREMLANVDLPLFIANEALLDAAAPSDEELEGLRAAPDDIACLQHSSGTTGLKKGVMLSHRAILAEVDAYARAIDLRDDDRIASWLPLYHDMGFVASFLTTLVRGLQLIALDAFEWAARPRLLLEAIERYRATLCWLPNFAFFHLVNTTRPSDAWDISSVRAFVSCSEPCKPRAFARFLERFASCGVSAQQLAICYALAENVFAVTQTQLGKAPRTAGAQGCDDVLSCGRPIDGVRIELRAPDGRCVAEGELGEIWIASPFLFLGYYRAPNLAASRLVDGWYATGDIGFMDGGELFVTGRIDDLLIVNGRNFYAHDLEEIVAGVEGCVPGRAVAFCAENQLRGTEELIVLAETHAAHDEPSIASAIKQAILDRLGIAPHAVRTLERGSLIKTTSGKISRSQNKHLYDQLRSQVK